MLRYVLAILATIPVVIMTSIIIFALMRLLPGDPSRFDRQAQSMSASKPSPICGRTSVSTGRFRFNIWRGFDGRPHWTSVARSAGSRFGRAPPRILPTVQIAHCLVHRADRRHTDRHRHRDSAQHLEGLARQHRRTRRAAMPISWSAGFDLFRAPALGPVAGVGLRVPFRRRRCSAKTTIFRR
jgi:hypothetical protein